MKQILNTVGSCASAAVKSIIMLLCVFVLGTSVLTSCGTEVDTITEECPNGDCPDPKPDPKPDPDPDVKAESVTKIGCEFGKNYWSAENAVLTRSTAYQLANRDGGVFGKINITYRAKTTFSDNSVKESQHPYSVNHSIAGFGYLGTRYVVKDAVKMFEQDPEITRSGDITFLSWGNGKAKIAFRTVTSKSVNSITINGFEKTDLCSAESEYSYERTEVINQGDSLDWTKYAVRIYGTAIASDGEDLAQNFYIEMAYRESKGSSPDPGPDPIDPEAVKYDVINKIVNKDGVTGDLIVIYSDGSQKNLGKVNIPLRTSTFTNPDQTVKVASFAYEKQNPSYTKNMKTGNVRSDYQLGCQIQITEMKNTITMKTDKAVATMGGLFEYPVLIDPLGVEHYWDIEGWSISQTGITDDGGNGNIMKLTYAANASYYGTNKALQSIVYLVKENTPGPDPDPDEKIQINAYPKDAHIEGSFIKWTLVRVFFYNGKETTEEKAMSIRHMCSLTTESRKTTFDRTYATTTPNMDLLSSEPFQDGNYYGTFVQYESLFSYPDFTNTIKSEGRTVVNYNDNGFKMTVWNEGLLVEKTGVDKSTNNVSTNPNQKVFIDHINYHLTNGGTEAATGRQEVAYTENNVTPGPDPTQQTGAYAKDAHIDGSLIKWTLVRTYSNADDEEIPMSVRHLGNLTTESRKTTEKRDYSITTPKMNLVSSESFKENNYFGTFCKYTSSFAYQDFTNVISSQGRTIVNYNDNGFEMEVWNEALLVEKTGQELGLYDISTDKDYNTYLDILNYHLTNGGAEVATGKQEVAYTKKADGGDGGEDKITRTFQEDGVENGKLYYYYIVTHSKNPELNSKTRHSVDLVGSISAKAVSPWTTKAENAGFNLTGNTDQVYDNARDYTFASNRGNNTANTSLQKDYTVSHDGYSHTFTVNGNIKASVNRTASSETSNTYTFKSDLYVNSVFFKTSSATVVETIEGSGAEDKVTKVIVKDRVENGKLYWIYKETHSQKPELDKTENGSEPIVYNLSATAVNDWTAKADATGISLNGSTNQIYVGAKNYTFVSNRGNNIANASLQTSYTVSAHGITETLTISGNVSGQVGLVSSSQNSNTYQFTAKLFADNVELVSRSDNAIETIEEDKPEDVITRSVEKVKVQNGQLYYNYIVKHSVNTDQNSTTEHSVPLEKSLSATAVNDWTAQNSQSGFNLTGSTSQSFGSNGRYTFSSNRGDNYADASLRTSYVVTHDGQNFTLTVNGTVSGQVSRIANAATSNTYQFVARLFADNVEIATASDNCVETVTPDPNPNPYGLVEIYSTVTFTTNATPKVTMAARYDNGNCIVYIDGQVVYKGTAPSGTISAIPTDTGWQAASIQEIGDYFVYSGVNGGSSTVTKADITYNKYPSGILPVNVTKNDDGTWRGSNNYTSATFGQY